MAGSRYEYGTSPRKIQPDYKTSQNRVKKTNDNKKIRTEEKTRAKNVAKTKSNKKNNVKTVLYVVTGFVILFAISYRNSLISENFAQIKNLKDDLAVVKKENEQLQVTIESNLNLSNVENEATSQLGMQKLTTAQTVYVNLPKQDYVEPATEKVAIEEDSGWLKTTFNKLVQKIN